LKNSFSSIEPMMALRVPDLPAGEWIYEMKFDAYRALAFESGSEVRLVSRNRTLFNDNYPRLVDSLEELKAKSFTLDGEIAALDAAGRSSFQLLQSYGVRKTIPLVYYVFDLLSLDGTDLRARPLIERRKRLARLLKKTPREHQVLRGVAGHQRRVGQGCAQLPARGPGSQQKKLHL
jgi:bifunctional non-homologous end joining protein LigD